MVNGKINIAVMILATTNVVEITPTLCKRLKYVCIKIMHACKAQLLDTAKIFTNNYTFYFK